MKKTSRSLPCLQLLATGALAASCLWAPAQLRAQNSYQGVSNPPADDTIQATSDAVATPAHAKPAPGVPVAKQPPSLSTPPAAGNLNDPNNPDYGIVTSVPAAGEAAPTPGERAYPASSTPASRETRLVSRPPENPDYGIVEMVPSPSNQLAEGTDIRVRLLQTLNTGTTQDGMPFRGQVEADVYKEGRIVIPIGSELRGRVMSVTQGHRMGSPATLRLRPEAVLLPDGTAYHLYAQAIHTDAPGTRTDSEGGLQPTPRLERNLVELGAGSGGGAATGAVFGGPVGAAAGALVGAGIVTAHLLLQHPHQALVEQGAEVTFSLTEPMDLLPTRN